MKLENIFLSTSSIKEVDGRAVSSGISPSTLMANGAASIYDCLNKRRVNLDSVAILCGRGGNGGNGYALACLLHSQGVRVCAVHISPPKNENAAKFMEKYLADGGYLLRYAEDADKAADLITSATLVVDALHGAAFTGELRGDELILVELANSTSGFITAVDIPTGISAGGKVSANCIMADLTVTFTVHKEATVSHPALGYCGEVAVTDIGIPEEFIRQAKTEGTILGAEDLDYLPARPQNSHKGNFGTLLALVGSPEMPGAAYLSALGALRSGVGLLKLTSDFETLSIMKNRLAEPIFVPFHKEYISEQRYSALLLGCGIGRRYDAVLDELLKRQNQITIIDADGINYLATHINVLMEMQGEVILTPHPGEMARLIGADVEYVNRNRIECARAFAMEYCLVLVLKGDRTVVASPNGEIFINTTGNSALSKGGSGDVLAGVIASLAAQGVTPLRAACLGVYVHGKAADNLRQKYGVRGMLPQDLPKEIGKLLG